VNKAVHPRRRFRSLEGAVASDLTAPSDPEACRVRAGGRQFPVNPPASRSPGCPSAIAAWGLVVVVGWASPTTIATNHFPHLPSKVPGTGSELKKYMVGDAHLTATAVLVKLRVARPPGIGLTGAAAQDFCRRITVDMLQK
jgi:hypothetical protein